MTTWSQARPVLPRGVWTCSIDLQDTYWHVPIAESFRPFLGFKIGRVKRQFRAMPFALNTAPRIFTNLCKEVLQVLRLMSIMLLVYLDH